MCSKGSRLRAKRRGEARKVGKPATATAVLEIDGAIGSHAGKGSLSQESVTGDWDDGTVRPPINMLDKTQH